MTERQDCKNASVAQALHHAGSWLLTPEFAGAVSIMSHVAEGFERLQVPEKLQFSNVARGSSAAVCSLLYVIEDTYPSLAVRSAALRQDVIRAGKLLTGLSQSTQQRRQSHKTPYANPNPNSHLPSKGGEDQMTRAAVHRPDTHDVWI